jgi:hypothetical protein
MSNETGSVDPLAYDAEHDDPAPADAADDSIGQGCCETDEVVDPEADR